MAESEKSESTKNKTTQVPTEHIFDQPITKNDERKAPKTISEYLSYIRFTEIWAPLIYTCLSIFDFWVAYHNWVVSPGWNTNVIIFTGMGIMFIIAALINHISAKRKRIGKS